MASFCSSMCAGFFCCPEYHQVRRTRSVSPRPTIAAAGDGAAWAAHPGSDHRPRPPSASGVQVRCFAQAACGGRG